jgi:hypothetical protein
MVREVLFPEAMEVAEVAMEASGVGLRCRRYVFL